MQDDILRWYECALCVHVCISDDMMMIVIMMKFEVECNCVKKLVTWFRSFGDLINKYNDDNAGEYIKCEKI